MLAVFPEKIPESISQRLGIDRPFRLRASTEESRERGRRLRLDLALRGLDENLVGIDQCFDRSVTLLPAHPLFQNVALQSLDLGGLVEHLEGLLDPSGFVIRLGQQSMILPLIRVLFDLLAHECGKAIEQSRSLGQARQQLRAIPAPAKVEGIGGLPRSDLRCLGEVVEGLLRLVVRRRQNGPELQQVG